MDDVLLLTILNNLADAVLVVDNNLNITLYNGAALNLLDINETITGKNLGDIMTISQKNEDQISLSDIVKDIHGTFISRDHKLIYGKDDHISLYLNISQLRNGFRSEDLHGYTIIMRDISHEKSLEEERDEFISVVSHELRTPIAIAEGDISNSLVLAKKKTTTKQR